MSRAGAAVILGVLFLNGCGGGGGGTDTAPPTNPPPGPSAITIAGQIQKGPFVTGASVTISSVSSGGATGARLASTTTSDDLGSFRASISPNQLVLIEGQGRFLNETDGTVSATTLSLSAIVDISSASSQVANINLLTHLSVPRIRNLLAGGASSQGAESQSHDELLTALAAVVAPPQMSAFKSVDLFSATQGDVESAYLVTVSALFAQRAQQISDSFGTNRTDELQVLIDTIAEDLSDGVLDYPNFLLAVRDTAYHIEPATIESSLTDLGMQQGSSEFAGDIYLFLDSDLDGVLNIDDTDDDNDGIADADDAYPTDWSCFLAADGDGSVCTVESRIPATFIPRAIDTDSNGVLHMLDPDNQQVMRWSIARQQYGFPIDVPFGATSLAFSPVHNRIFVGMGSTGDVLAIEPAGEHTTALFSTIGVTVGGISRAGDYLVVIDSIGNWYSLDADGMVVDQRRVIPAGLVEGLAWNDTTSRLYTLIEEGSGARFEYFTVDQQTGALGVPQSAPEVDTFEHDGRIYLSGDGSRIAVGNGDIFAADDLEWELSLPGYYSDVAWLEAASIAAIRSKDSNETRLERRGVRGELIEYAEYPGDPLHVIAHEGRLVIMTLTTTTELHSFVIGGDQDRDGVVNREDAFPMDPAASIDTDRDGYPDSWNAGKTMVDSTTGLVTDPYPLDSACSEDWQGDGTTCDIALGLGSIDPFFTQVDANGVVYMFELDTRRVVRWDSTNGYANPLRLGEASDDSVIMMRYSPEQHRLYLGYLQGKITYFDLSDPGQEHYFASTPTILRALQPAGNFLWAGGHDGRAVDTYSLTFDVAGNWAGLDAAGKYSWNSAWNPVLDRVYFIEERTGTELHYQYVDQVTGQLSAATDSPYEADQKYVGPVRVSPEGDRVLIGSGDIYNATDLTWVGAIQPGFEDIQWGENGDIVYVHNDFSYFPVHTRIARKSIDGTLQELSIVPGSVVALRRDGTDFRLITGGPNFYRYRPSNDTDNDGIENSADAFPLDPSASADTDADGHPDAWNAGMSAADSNTGLELDAYPGDSACYLPEQGDGSVCDIAATIPDYVPDEVAIDSRGIVYLFSWRTRRVYRWDAVTQQHLNPYVLGKDPWLGERLPASMTYHPAHDRVYLGYGGLDVKYIDPREGPDEHYFVTLESSASGLAPIGRLLLTVDDLTGAVHTLVDADGLVLDSQRAERSLDYTWDPVLGRLYFFYGTGSTSELRYETIDQASGQFTGNGSPGISYDYAAMPPIRVSIDGARIITGAGDLYDWQYLYRTGSLPGDFADARWLADGGIVAVRDAGGDTSFERRDSAGDLIEVERYSGAPLAILPYGQNFVVVTDEGSPSFRQHTVSDDSDGDGIVNTVDAFPLDPAASVDTDGDGAPDVWHAGMSGADSTTGLTIDAYAADAACQLVEHGDGVVCDIASTIPDYTPDKIEIDANGIVYLFSQANRRVYRWDVTTQQHLNPILVGSDQWVDDTAPVQMTYHPGHTRLYFGYDDGNVTFVDLTGGGEQRLASLSLPVGGLSEAGNYLMAFGREDITGIANVLDSSGILAFVRDNTYWSSAYAWNPVLERLYHFRDAYQNNYLMAKLINQVTGRINGTLEPTNDGTLGIAPPIRISPNGNNVVIGSGNIFNSADLTWQFGLDQPVVDAAWLNDGRLVTIWANGADTIVEVLDASYQSESTSALPNSPVAALRYGNDVVVVTSAGQPEFTVVTP